MKAVPFYDINEPNEEFSQSYISSFKINGKQYNSAEQYMISQKALFAKNQEVYKMIMDTDNGDYMHNLGRLLKLDLEQWNLLKEDIVYAGNLAKFSQSPTLKQKILSTGDSILVEATSYDKIWGSGIDAKDLVDSEGNLLVPVEQWPGQNLLGKILMRVRSDIKNFMS